MKIDISNPTKAGVITITVEDADGKVIAKETTKDADEAVKLRDGLFDKHVRGIE